MFTIKIETMKGETWWHCYGGRVSKDYKDAHRFLNIGRAKSVMMQRYGKEVGRSLKSISTKDRETQK
ncbi:MAG: hypothetical protein EBZ61_06660 [Micrococcales bacterium]|nr:hypothetical protein [Micrococcales bacterium]